MIRPSKWIVVRHKAQHRLDPLRPGRSRMKRSMKLEVAVFLVLETAGWTACPVSRRQYCFPWLVAKGGRVTKVWRRMWMRSCLRLVAEHRSWTL